MVTMGVKKIDWSDRKIINTDEFDGFRISDYDPDATPRKLPYPTGTTTSTPTFLTPRPSSSSTISQANLFKRGIKRDKDHYPKLRDEKNWDEDYFYRPFPQL